MGRPVAFPNKKLIGFDEEMLALIDEWQRKQSPLPNFSDAVRLLVERGLQADEYVRLLDKSMDVIGSLAREEDRTPALAVEVIGILGGYKSRSKRTSEFQQQLQNIADGEETQ